MITLNDQRSIEKIGSLGEERKFQIKNTAKAFRIFIGNLYSDKTGAVLRELSANCFDSHAAAQNQNPFEVNLPSKFEPVFSVRDFGTGMSHEFMMNNYTTAFSSSKDESNEFVGALGLGRLSALSLCDAYTCSSFRDGIKRDYSVYLDPDGIPSIIFLGENPTNEANGFFVEIPVNPELADSFENKARNTFRHYKVKPVIKNRDNFEIPKNEYILVADDNSFGLMGGGHKSVAIMGNYSYPILIGSLGQLTSIQENFLRCGAVVNFNIGELDVQANREGLHYNKLTIENIKKKLDLIIPQIQPMIISFFDNKSVFEKCALQFDLLSYKGKLHNIGSLVREILTEKIPTQFDFEGCAVKSFSMAYRRGRERMSMSEPGAIEYQDNVVFYFVDKKSYPALRAKKFLATNPGKRIVFIRPVDIEAIFKFKEKYGFDIRNFPKSSELPFDKPEIGGEREFNILKFSRNIYNGAKCCWMADKDFDPGEDIIYVERQGYSVDFNSSKSYNMNMFLDNVNRLETLLGKKITVYGLTPRQLKGTPDNWRSFSEAMEEALEEWTKNNCDKIAAYQYFKDNYYNWSNNFDCFEFPVGTLAHKIKAEYVKLCETFNGIDQELMNKCKITPSTEFKYNKTIFDENYPLVNSLYFNKNSENVKKDIEQYVLSKNLVDI